MITLFDLVNGDIIVNKDILAAKIIKDLFRRDRGGVIDGDFNGAKKLRSMAELGVIWYCVNLNSPGIQKGKEGKELELEAVRFFGLPDTWKKDDAFNAVMEWYENEYEEMVAPKVIRTLIASVNQTIDISTNVNKFVDMLIKAGDLNKDNAAELIKLNKEITSMVGEVPGNIRKLKQLELEYLKIEKAARLARGKIVISDSMIPPTK